MAIALAMGVTPNLQPSVSISVGSTQACEGDALHFIADPTHGGTSPTYQWKRTGVSISGATSRTYTTSDFSVWSVTIPVKVSQDSGAK